MSRLYCFLNIIVPFLLLLFCFAWWLKAKLLIKKTNIAFYTTPLCEHQIKQTESDKTHTSFTQMNKSYDEHCFCGNILSHDNMLKSIYTHKTWLVTFTKKSRLKESARLHPTNHSSLMSRKRKEGWSNDWEKAMRSYSPDSYSPKSSVSTQLMILAHRQCGKKTCT